MGSAAGYTMFFRLESDVAPRKDQTPTLHASASGPRSVHESFMFSGFPWLVSLLPVFAHSGRVLLHVPETERVFLQEIHAYTVLDLWLRWFFKSPKPYQS